MSSNTNEMDLEEGSLYVVKKGELVEIPREDETGTRKLRVTDAAFGSVEEVQKQMRKRLNGYKPDIGLVASAMLRHAATKADVGDAVAAFAIEVFSQQSGK